MPKRLKGVWILALFVLVGLSALSEEQAAFPFSFTQYQLENGLRVILSEDDSLPIVSVVMAYHVGSIDEQPGKTGLAYLLENMMFMGSLNIGPMQHISYVNRIGGTPNASTTEDITFFYETVPMNQLALVLWLESDRMKALDINSAKVQRSKQALLDEIAQRKLDEPYFESSLVFDRLLYSDFPHSHPILGSEEDIENLTLEEVKDFYSTFYVPNNAVLAIVGKFDLTKAKELVERYFGTIPQGKDIPLSPPPQPLKRKQVVEVVQEALAPAPAFHLGYRIAPPYSPESYPLVIIDYILLKGKSSRLYRRLVQKDNLALYLSGGIEKRKDVAVFKIFVMNNSAPLAELCQKAIFSEISKLRTSYVSAGELQRAKNMFKRDYLSRFANPQDRAMFLVETLFSPVSLENAPQELGKYLGITPLQVIGMINRYIIPENSILLNVKTR